MRKVFRAIGKAAKASAIVLISGESGTGKELVARAVHYSGNRSAAPFLPVNCGCIPEGLLESELFGYVKGAFTGATESRAGFFQAADGEPFSRRNQRNQPQHAGQAPPRTRRQTGLHGRSSRPRKVDVRIVAASNKNLPALVKADMFREDLYYRLNVLTIALPPLRDRGNDILLLIRYFAAKFAKELGRASPRFSDKSLDAMKKRLPLARQRARVGECGSPLARDDEGDTVEVADLPAMMRFFRSPPTRFDRSLAEVEAEYVRNVLANVGGNRTKAATILASTARHCGKASKSMEGNEIASLSSTAKIFAGVDLPLRRLHANFLGFQSLLPSASRQFPLAGVCSG